MAEQFTSYTETFRAVYSHMLAEWCREDSLAEFDRLIDRVRREAAVKELRSAANDMHRGWCQEGGPSDWLEDRADQLEQEGKNHD